MAGASRENVDVATITRYVLILLGFILLAVLLSRIVIILEVIYISLIVAAALHPITIVLQRRMPRSVAIIMIYLTLAGVAILLGYVVFPPLILQLGAFLTTLPDQVEGIRGFLGTIDYWLAQSGVPIDLEGLASQVGSQIGALILRLIQIPFLVYQGIVSLFAIVTLSFYWQIDRDRILASLLRLMPFEQRGRARLIYIRAEERLGSFVRGLAIASALVGVITYVGLLLLGVPFPLLLAILAALLEVVPIIGPVIAAVPIVGIAFTQSLGLGMVTLIFWIGVQQLEGYVITPIVQRESVRLPPFTILLAVLVGGGLFGILGTLLAVPTAVLIAIILYELSPGHQHRDDEATP